MCCDLVYEVTGDVWYSLLDDGLLRSCTLFFHGHRMCTARTSTDTILKDTQYQEKDKLFGWSKWQAEGHVGNNFGRQWCITKSIFLFLRESKPARS